MPHLMRLWFGRDKQPNSVWNFFCLWCSRFSIFYNILNILRRINDIYQHVQDPAQDNWRNKALESIHFKLCPPGGPGTDLMAWKTLKRQVVAMDTPLSTARTYGKNLQVKPLSVWCHPKFLTVESSRKQNQDVGCHQIPDNKIYGPQPIPRAIKQETMVKNTEIPQDSKYSL